MTKQRKINVIVVFLMIVLLVGVLVACGKTETGHTHNFNVKSTDSKYLKSAATTTNKAVYYYSCSCGEKGTETFEYGEPLSDNNGGNEQESSVNDFEFEEVEGGYKLSAYKGMAANVVIPSTYNNKPVTEIGEEAFGMNMRIINVTIPDSVTVIGDSAFGECYRLTTVTIGNGVTIIYDAFNGCTGLTSITIGSSVEIIGEEAFSGCEKLVEVYNKSSLNIQKGSEDYGEVAYYAKDVYTSEYTSKLSTDSDGFIIYTDGDTKSLMGYVGNETNIVLPQGFADIYIYAFYCCFELTSVTILDNVTSIGYEAFAGCLKLVEVYNKSSLNIQKGSEDYGGVAYYAKEVYTSEYTSKLSIDSDGFIVYTDGDTKSLIGYMGSETNIVLPQGITEIYNHAFSLNFRITDVTIPDGVMSIGDSAFYYCLKLSNIKMPNGVTSIGRSAFCGCMGLTSVTISAGVTSIGDYAFWGCSGLTSVTIPAGVTSIGDYAFWDCNGLMSVTIPDSVTSIGDGAFSGCSGLTNLTIPDSVTSIGDGAFYGCSGLTSVTIPANVASIGGQAFYECSTLTAVNWNATACTLDSGWSQSVFGNCDKLAVVNIGDNVTTIPNGVFAECSGIKEVTIGVGVTSIGDSAFYGCSELTTVNWNATACTIENGGPFWGCESLSNVNIGNNVKTIPNGVFAGGRFTSIIIPDSVTSIGEFAFYVCVGLTSVKIGSGVTSIGDYAFYGCSSLTSITIPDSVTSIGNHTFAFCRGLTSVTIGSGVTSIDELAFRECENLTEIRYKGTCEEWQSISDGYNRDWDYDTGNYTVYCSDGTVSKYGTVTKA